MMPPGWRPPNLETDRLIMRAFRESDAAPLFTHASNPTVTKFTLWDHHKTIADSLFFVRDYAHCRYIEGVPEPYAITLRDDPSQAPIGSIGCFWVSEPNKCMELGYWLAEPFWGKGITVEAARAVLIFAFIASGPERIQARVIVGNTASVRVLEKLGFRSEGTLRSSLLRRGQYEDVMYFSVLRSEYEKW